MEESDVKIYNPGKKNNAPDEAAEIAALTQALTEDGSLERARALGEMISTLLPEDAAFADVIGGAKLLSGELFNLRVLMVFAAHTALESCMPVRLLSSAAISKMYDGLIAATPNFYDAVADGTAFTFYHLALRRPEPAKEIGVEYAKLCGKEGSEALMAIGTAMYEKTLQLVENRWQEG